MIIKRKLYSLKSGVITAGIVAAPPIIGAGIGALKNKKKKDPDIENIKRSLKYTIENKEDTINHMSKESGKDWEDHWDFDYVPTKEEQKKYLKEQKDRLNKMKSDLKELDINPEKVIKEYKSKDIKRGAAIGATLGAGIGIPTLAIGAGIARKLIKK